jgi:hypothetical protein
VFCERGLKIEIPRSCSEEYMMVAVVHDARMIHMFLYFFIMASSSLSLVTTVETIGGQIQ